MAIIGYGPWTDAANVGAGIGNSIARVLFEVPAIKRQMRLQEQQMQMQQQRFDLEQARIPLEQKKLEAEADLSKMKANTFMEDRATKQKEDKLDSIGRVVGEVTAFQKAQGQEKYNQGRLEETKRHNQVAEGNQKLSLKARLLSEQEKANRSKEWMYNAEVNRNLRVDELRLKELDAQVLAKESGLQVPTLRSLVEDAAGRRTNLNPAQVDNEVVEPGQSVDPLVTEGVGIVSRIQSAVKYLRQQQANQVQAQALTPAAPMQRSVQAPTQAPVAQAQSEIVVSPKPGTNEKSPNPNFRWKVRNVTTGQTFWSDTHPEILGAEYEEVQ